MLINTTDLNAVSGFYAVNFEIYLQTMDESEITFICEMGGGVTIHHGTRYGEPIWFMDNPMGTLRGIWVEMSGQHQH